MGSKMNRRTFIRTGTSVAAVSALTACSDTPGGYTGPPVTSIVVQKERRQMFLMNENNVLKRYDIDLGFSPVGHKQIEGDGKTPEGAYFIDRKNPNSRFHLSIGISYPNTKDRARARALGRPPGGDIFIHGTPSLARNKNDWTWGCLAVTNSEMDDIYAMVNVGTPIYLYP